MDASIFEALCSPLVVAAIGFVSMLIGGLVGHRLTHWRDRRKERNDAAKEIRAILFKHRSNIVPYAVNPTAFEYDTLEHLLPILKRRGFRKAIKSYDESREPIKQDSVGQAFYIDDDSVKASLEKLIRYTEWR